MNAGGGGGLRLPLPGQDWNGGFPRVALSPAGAGLRSTRGNIRSSRRDERQDEMR